jgi:hypothetical protein
MLCEPENQDDEQDDQQDADDSSDVHVSTPFVGDQRQSSAAASAENIASVNHR